jgi:hypothetical protein
MRVLIHCVDWKHAIGLYVGVHSKKSVSLQYSPNFRLFFVVVFDGRQSAVGILLSSPPFLALYTFLLSGFYFVLFNHWLNRELDLQCLFGLHVHSCTHWLRPRNSPSPRIWPHIQGRYWSAKIDDISLWPPSLTLRISKLSAARFAGRPGWPSAPVYADTVHAKGSAP